uniref:Uncharacterized protein n=1 Tax=Oryza sativa subsp. japonica TaxID=39947 RepID=Q6K7U9_ORYSJ|nr:hypothetical protein [Oryza sativa Japonica Group]BAD28291.1 hypothetical protein [Oryza sativa Japonica Group]
MGDTATELAWDPCGPHIELWERRRASVASEGRRVGGGGRSCGRPAGEEQCAGDGGRSDGRRSGVGRPLRPCRRRQHGARGAPLPVLVSSAALDSLPFPSPAVSIPTPAAATAHLAVSAPDFDAAGALFACLGGHVHRTVEEGGASVLASDEADAVSSLAAVSPATASSPASSRFLPSR